MTSSAQDVFRGMDRSRQFDRPTGPPWHFPTRADYVRHLISKGRITSESELIRHPELAAAIQRHWHGEAQHGCRFAQLLSRAPKTDEWRSIVVPAADGAGVLRHVDELRKRLSEFERAAETQAVSILLPAVTSVAALVSCLRVFRDTLGWSVAVVGEGDTTRSVQIRVPLAEGTIESWAIGFAPLECLPLTRQGPMTEIAFSVKPKRLPPRSERLNADPHTAHVADLPVPLDDKTFDHFWDDSHAVRLMLVQDFDPAQVRARVTFCLPLSPTQRAELAS